MHATTHGLTWRADHTLTPCETVRVTCVDATPSLRFQKKRSRRSLPNNTDTVHSSPERIVNELRGHRKLDHLGQTGLQGSRQSSQGGTDSRPEFRVYKPGNQSQRGNTAVCFTTTRASFQFCVVVQMGTFHVLLTAWQSLEESTIAAGDPCMTYTEIYEPHRSTAHVVTGGFSCDVGLQPGWYRFTAYTGGKMAEECQDTGHCGTRTPIWLNGIHPDIADGITDMTACISYGLNLCCVTEISIQVKKCPEGFYVYNLAAPYGCDSGYCVGARPRLVEPSSDTGTKLARSTHDFKNFAQVGRGTEGGRPNISRSSREGRPYSATVARFSKTKFGRDSGELRPSYARAGNELCDLKNRRRLVADVKNTFRVSARFGRLQKIAGDPENSRDARLNIGRTTAVNVV
ncbi:hypothetical protein Bbelb_066170 [Branchiostoma belcheri]|nr:hypothetical protein Bbelb_066170 [Branchiostoma belcheri]